ncbi:YcaO-like family protein [Thermomonospora umbrina]|uniref:Ribosomal protein S12 methylthiotransferase accessory factor n=1 Tax=Thermomonospora umbrina TaxID=111806 RepID=A0A3D9T2H8_9ACTN|nr:YcaO-like family protein [Thermomonospora umbrina]REF01051.1 ribosomal protein S12 methylthiotransferase accessory factor [Thermomonospora umbrina]
MIPGLLDPRCGPVRALGIDRSHGVLHTATAELAATDGFALPLGNPVVGGTSWASPQEAARRALGEAAERYAGHLVPADRLVRSAWRNLGAAAIDPETLALYSPDQLGRPGFPFVGLRRDTVTCWVTGRTAAGTDRLVPASLVWLAPGEHAESEGRPLHLPVAAGIAAGPTPAAARSAALAEVVERHALATAWHAGWAFPPLAVQPSPVPDGVRLRWFQVPNLLGAPVVLCTAEGHGDRLGVGCALAPNAADPVASAGAKAAAEALVSLDTLDAVIEGIPEWSGVLKPHREDRCYGDDYRPDLSDATDLVCTLQLLADPRTARRILARLTAGRPGGRWRPGPIDLDTAAAAHGLLVVTIDITPPDLARLGLAVARVVVPGLRSTGPAAFPFLGDGAEPLPSAPERLPMPHV